MRVGHFRFPLFSGVRVLMMPIIQGDPDSLPGECSAYAGFVENYYFERGEPGWLTIDEKIVEAGQIHRNARSEHARAVHTEAGYVAQNESHYIHRYCWGGNPEIALADNTQILLANNSAGTCCVWSEECTTTTRTGDLGAHADYWPYENGHMLEPGEIWRINHLNPHECLPCRRTEPRQFLRLIGNTVNGRENYWTRNPVLEQVA